MGIKDQKNSNGKKSDEGSASDKIKSAISSASPLDDFVEYAKNHKYQVVTYLILIIGLILLFADRFLGGLILGGVGGFYFSNEILSFLKRIGSFFSNESQWNDAVIVLILVGLFIAAPGFFIGALLVAGIRRLLNRN